MEGGGLLVLSLCLLEGAGVKPVVNSVRPLRVTPCDELHSTKQTSERATKFEEEEV